MVTGSQLVQDLTRSLSLRRVSDGIALLDAAEGCWAKLTPNHPHATELLLLIAQWVDVGYHDHHLLEPLLAKFPVECRSRMALLDYLRLRMVEGFRALSAEETDTAIEVLGFVLQLEPALADQHLTTLAHFWKGRAHRKKGEYEVALKEIVLAREQAQDSRESTVFTSVIQIHESWLLFQKGLRKEALSLLSQAEAVLKDTDHYLARGNIESARGRIVRRSGEYAKALEHFDNAISLYLKGTPTHRNLARALVNAAYVNRLVALQLRKRIDAQTQRPQQSSQRQKSAPPPAVPDCVPGISSFATGRLRSYDKRERSTLCTAIPEGLGR